MNRQFPRFKGSTRKKMLTRNSCVIRPTPLSADSLIVARWHSSGLTGNASPWPLFPFSSNRDKKKEGKKERNKKKKKRKREITGNSRLGPTRIIIADKPTDPYRVQRHNYHRAGGRLRVTRPRTYRALFRSNSERHRQMRVTRELGP